LFFCESALFHGSCPLDWVVYHEPLILVGLVFGDQVIGEWSTNGPRKGIALSGNLVDVAQLAYF
jgi:hypothetical protein